MHMLIRYLIIVSIVVIANNPLFALNDKNIPSDLLEWKAWVLDDIKDLECPFVYNSKKKVCSWPSAMDINLKDNIVDFNITWQVFKDDARVVLPGDKENWAYDVQVDGKKTIVTDHGIATLFLDKGLHQISAKINYKDTTKFLKLPPNVALVKLYKDGDEVSNIKIDKHNRLWFKESAKVVSKKGNISLSIYRKVRDAHPIHVETYLHLRVSGKSRSVLIDGILLDGFSPLSVSSKLQASITKKHQLKLQVRAGEWVVKVNSYHPDAITTLKESKVSLVSSDQEVWVFESESNYRTVEIEGVTAIDATQTNLPKKWKHLPAYLMDSKSVMKIKPLYQGKELGQKNSLSLNRQLWLDFDGAGYTIKDQISGTINQIQRLEALHFDLGSVEIDNRPKLITTLKKSDKKGVELRAKSLNLNAISRYNGNISKPPANGWSEKFIKQNAQLNLPPGWKLFASFGSDNRGKSWIEKWDLMDIFLVLLLGIALYQLYGWSLAIVSTAFLILLWQERDAPTIIWLFLLAVVALLRVIDKGRIKKVLNIGFMLLIAVAVMQVLVFSIYEIRTALYPQFEKHDIYYPSRGLNIPMREDSIGMDSVAESKAIVKRKIGKYNKQDTYMQSVPVSTRNIAQNKIDPDSVVQTGPGIPGWHWQTHQFSWQSGVGSDDKLSLWLISPIMNKVLNILRIIGMLFLLYIFLKAYTKPMIEKVKEQFWAKDSIKALFILAVILQAPMDLKADIPSPKLLKELKNKLLQAPQCLPNCAQIEKISFRAIDDKLSIKIDTSVGSDTAIPLIGNRDTWLPQSVKVDDDENVNLRLDKQGTLWVMLSKGVHTVLLEGSMKGSDVVVLSSQLTLHNLSIAHDDRWKIQSDKSSYIQFNRINIEAKKQKKKVKSGIKPLIEITRTFDFGLRWYVNTYVRVLNHVNKEFTISYDLLPDEYVLNKNLEIKDAKVLMHFRAGQTTLNWKSSLPQSSTLALKASEKPMIIEIWKTDISPLWHMYSEGIKSVEESQYGASLVPVYKPWQGEELILKPEKAKAVKGESLTIESSELKVTQSQRYRDLNLILKIKSSQARQHSITLANVKELKSVIIDTKSQHLKIENGKLILPLQAKTQIITISWQEEHQTNAKYKFTDIDLGIQSVNSKVILRLPNNRWVLWVKGALLGPAVLFWGIILALLIFAFILGKAKISPLKTRDWFLLGLGMSTASILVLLPILVWILVLKYRESKANELKGLWRNLVQIALVLLTVVALLTIFGCVSMGLLSTPDMMIEGNSSHAYNLNWYSDRISNMIEMPTVISVSIWYYRILMLLWAIWISFSMIKWLKWAWGIFSQGNMWEEVDKIKKNTKIKKREE